MTRRRILQDFQNESLQEQFAYIVFLLMKELGLGHEEVFGSYSRPSMKVKKFMTYVDLLEKHEKEKKKQSHRENSAKKKRSFG